MFFIGPGFLTLPYLPHSYRGCHLITPIKIKPANNNVIMLLRPFNFEGEKSAWSVDKLDKPFSFLMVLSFTIIQFLPGRKGCYYYMYITRTIYKWWALCLKAFFKEGLYTSMNTPCKSRICISRCIPSAYYTCSSFSYFHDKTYKIFYEVLCVAGTCQWALYTYTYVCETICMTRYCVTCEVVIKIWRAARL